MLFYKFAKLLQGPIRAWKFNRIVFIVGFGEKYRGETLDCVRTVRDVIRCTVHLRDDEVLRFVVLLSQFFENGFHLFTVSAPRGVELNENIFVFV